MYTVSILHSSHVGVLYWPCIQVVIMSLTASLDMWRKMVDCTEAIKIKSAITHFNLIVLH